MKFRVHGPHYMCCRYSTEPTEIERRTPAMKHENMVKGADPIRVSNVRPSQRTPHGRYDQRAQESASLRTVAAPTGRARSANAYLEHRVQFHIAQRQR